MRTRTTDKKFNGLCWITRHIKDDPSQPTYTTYFAKIPNGNKSPRLVKVGSDKDQLSLAVLRERAKDEISKVSTRGNSDHTLNSFFDEIFIKDRERKKTETLRHFFYMWDNNIRNTLGMKRMVDLETIDIYQEFMKISERSESVANKCLQHIKSCYALAMDLGLVKFNPASSVKKNASENRIRFFNADQTVRFKKALFSLGEDHKFATALIYALYLTGARFGELRDAKWSDLHGNKIVRSKHKTKKITGQDRIIYLSPEAMNLINRLPKDNEYIFNCKYVKTAWNKIREIADLKEFHLHDLRHNFCTQAINNGIDLIRVGKLVGHKSVETMEKYAHVLDQTSDNDIKQIGNLLS